MQCTQHTDSTAFFIHSYLDARRIFRSETDLISLLILFLFLLGRPLQKRLTLRRFKSDAIWHERLFFK